MDTEIILNIKADELFRPLNHAMQFGIDTEDMLVIQYRYKKEDDRMAEYFLDLDLLEAAKEEYIGSAEKMNADIDTAHVAIGNTGADIYKGIDADIFRKDFTGYVDKDFAEAWEMVSKIGTALENGLDDARECKIALQ